jgi:hypothetical protein
MSDEPTMTINAYGTKEWRLNDRLHRTDGPAIEWANGTKMWWQNDQRHRTDGPAIEYVDGRKEWWQNGHLHRTDGPAIERASGTKEWWQNGQRHRVDGPAAEWADGDRAWYLHGTRYNPAGPPPVVLAVDTENTHYGLLRIGTRYLAGCRRFDTVESALAHWREQDTPRARLFVAALEKELQFRSLP